MRGRGRLLRSLGAVAATVVLLLAGCARPAGLQPVAPPTVSSEPTDSRVPSPTASAPRPTPHSEAVTTGTPAGAVSSALPVAPSKIAFSVNRILSDCSVIETLGVRIAGSAAEHAAADLILGRLRRLGYKPRVETFRVPGGRSHNITVRVPGRSASTVVVTGHTDTRPTTRGANDDALGCAIVLELARIYANRTPANTLELTFFGAEEYDNGAHPDHHRGSRYHVAHLTDGELADTLAMISVDVVGYGRTLHVRTMGIGPSSLASFMVARARALGVGLTSLHDPGPTGWSDHEPYEKAGVPAVWLERLTDPQYHKMGDTTAHLQRTTLAPAMRLLTDVIRRATPEVVPGG